MLRPLLFVGGRVIAAAFAAIAVGIDASGAGFLSASDSSLRLAALVSALVFGGITAWREFDLYVRPRPKVEFVDVSPDTKPVEITWHDRSGQHKQILKGNFHRIRVENLSLDPSGEGSTARELSAEIELVNVSGILVERWTGRWADLEEADSPGKKWVVDKIDLPPNGQKPTLDIGVNYEGKQGFNRWDNTRYVGDYKANPHLDPVYDIRVTLGANNMRKKELRFRLDNAKDASRLILLRKRRGKWIPAV
jgi:hypothetical protein